MAAEVRAAGRRALVVMAGVSTEADVAALFDATDRFDDEKLPGEMLMTYTLRPVSIGTS